MLIEQCIGGSMAEGPVRSIGNFTNDIDSRVLGWNRRLRPEAFAPLPKGRHAGRAEADRRLGWVVS